MQNTLSKINTILDECSLHELVSLLDFYEVKEVLGAEGAVGVITHEKESLLRDLLKQKFADGTLHPRIMVNHRVDEIGHAMIQMGSVEAQQLFLKEHNFPVIEGEQINDTHHRMWRYITDGELDPMCVVPYDTTSRLLKPDVAEVWPLYICASTYRPVDKDGNFITPDEGDDEYDYQYRGIKVQTGLPVDESVLLAFLAKDHWEVAEAS